MDVSPFTIEFDQSLETKMLNEHIHQERNKLKGKWKNLMDDIEKTFSVAVTDNTGMVNNSPCLYFSFHPTRNGYLGKLHVWISLLVPYFLIEIFQYKEGQLNTDEIFAFQSEILHKTINTVIQNFDMELFPTELLNAPVPGIELQDSKNGEATLREVLFADYIAHF
ncbi:MAG: hypothetical protein V4539_08380 [Bacteroidota bacterium]